MKQGVTEKVEAVETVDGAPQAAPKRGGKRAAGQRNGGMQRQAQLLLNVANKVAGESTLDGQLQMLIELSVAAAGAERGSLFLKDDATGELYTRIAQGTSNREIRIPPDTGIAGHVFTSGEGVFENDAYANPKFNRAIDERTGFTTKKILCAPVRTVRGEIIGVIQILNKAKGDFTKTDLILVEAMTQQASIVLQSTMHIESAQRFRLQESQFIDVVSEVSKEIQLGPLLQKIMASVTELLQSERSTLFLNDEKTNMLYTEIGQGLGAARIRFPNHLGIAGTVFTSGKSVNIPYAYADLRFNPSFDKQTGFFTRSILCVPVINKDGKTIGVTQVLNKRGGTFTQGDETRLKAFTAQIAICLENAKLFDDVQNMKNYHEAMLESMSNGVITFDDKSKIVTCNVAGARILRTTANEICGRKAEEFFIGPNAWIVERMLRVQETQKSDVLMDAEMASGGEKSSVNVTFLPLQSNRQEKMGTMLLIEDISSEKRVKATMSRYMDPSLADKLISAGEEILGGQASAATVLFSDIRSFTTLTEELGPQGTVQMLNEYFTVMVECIQKEGGMLDKFIGDAIMAVFGTPLAHDDDEDRAVRSAITMMRNLELFNADRIKHGKMPIDIGVGINTDVIVSGNIGSPKRMDYTVIGDGVNLASRLEGATKEYAAHILLSENTVAKLRGTYRVREIDWVVVKGKTKPVAIYELLDYHTEESFPNLVEVLPSFKGGLSRYREGRFDDAIASFQRCLEYNPRDKLSGLYVTRCEYLKKNPPEGKWDGIWRMKSK